MLVNKRPKTILPFNNRVLRLVSFGTSRNNSFWEDVTQKISIFVLENISPLIIKWLILPNLNIPWSNIIKKCMKMLNE
jgi:hypothetical protein